MRYAILIAALLTPWISIVAQEEAKILTPEAAAKRIDERVIVQMEVKSTGGNTARYLNSEIDYRSEKIRGPHSSGRPGQVPQSRHRRSGQYYKGKTIQVAGTVTLGTARAFPSGKPEIRVEDPAQIKVVEKDAEVTKPKAAAKAVKNKGGRPK